MKAKEKDFTVKYTYTDVWGHVIMDRFSCDTKQKAYDFMSKLQSRAKVESLFLETNERFI